MKNISLLFFSIIFCLSSNSIALNIEDNCKVKIGNFIVAENGRVSENLDEKKLHEYMEWDSIEIEINLKLGNDAFKCYTCDFTHDYIDINANYRN